MEFRICFSTAKNEIDIFSLCVISNAFIHAFCLSKIHFRQTGSLKSEIVSLLLGLSPVWNRYPKGSHTTLAIKRSV